MAAIAIPNARDESYFAPIPSYYYEKQLESDYTIAGDFVSALKFCITPEELKEEGWEDGIWVTAESSVGPNVGDILEYIITRFTGITVSSSSVTHLNTVCSDTPCNFVLYEKKNALEFVREIAWQSRSAVLFDQGEARFIYVGEEPLSIMTLNDRCILVSHN